jgi:hypothetical protein
MPWPQLPFGGFEMKSVRGRAHHALERLAIIREEIRRRKEMPKLRERGVAL